MQCIHAGLVAVLCGSGCIGAEQPSVDDTPGEHAQQVLVAGATDAAEDICALLPECGPCANACDEGVLAAQIPPGTCAAFLCELIDGRQVTFHACHHE